MMRIVLGLVLLVGIVSSEGADSYNTRYDNIDVDEVLNNERLFKRYFNCLANRGSCTPDVKELKGNLPDALKNGCSKCSEKQKASAEKVFKHLIEKRPKEWEILENIYDPEGEYRMKYKEEAKKRGIKI